MNIFNEIPQNMNSTCPDIGNNYFDMDLYISKCCEEFYESNKNKYSGENLRKKLRNFRNTLKKRKEYYDKYIDIFVTSFKFDFNDGKCSNLIVINCTFELLGDDQKLMFDLAVKNFHNQLILKGYDVKISNNEYIIKCAADGTVLINTIKICVFFDKLVMAKL